MMITREMNNKSQQLNTHIPYEVVSEMEGALEERETKPPLEKVKSPTASTKLTVMMC